MKKIFHTLLILVASVLVTNVMAQTFETRIIGNDYGYLEVQMQETSGTGTPTTATIVNDISFEIRWLTALSTDVSIICASNDYTLADALGSLQTSGSYSYRVFQAVTTPLNPPENWTQNTWMTIATFKATSGSGSGSFEIAPDGWVAQGLNWNQGDPPVDYTPTVNGQADSYTYPTIVYDLVWTGADATYPTYWDVAANWETVCGSAGSIPNTGNSCVIPIVSSGNYPINIGQVSGFGIHQPICDYLRINSGTSMSIDNEDFGSAQALYTINNSLTVYGTLTIIPSGELTVSGASYIDAAAGLVVQATSSGIGSFIDNGTITYGTSGTAKVQTYLTGSGSAGTYDFHCVGPTVDITGTGVTASEFNVVAGETYIYKYNEPTDTWVNFYGLGDPVPTAKGIGLSTNNGSTNIMEMTGELKTGAISSEAMTITGNGSYLLSNPYPSSVYWNDLYSNNSANVNDKVYVYDGTNYQSYNNSGGTNGFTGYLQVGQGFFIEATGASVFTFDNGDRHHSDAAFYKSGDFTNRLDVRVTGNESTDGLLVHFYEGATSGYEANEDVQKKMSYSENATQFWTVLEDGQNMSINAMPLELLGKGMQSVPMSFICSATSEYTMNFLDMETFEAGTEIWLEDKQTGAEWISINDNPDYTFTATADDLEDRFVLHFFGPTGVSEFEIENTVEIFSYREKAFVRNNTNEVIKKVNIYTLAGKLLQDNEPANIKLNSFWVSNNVGYYVVHVITDKNVYTEKVFISK